MNGITLWRPTRRVLWLGDALDRFFDDPFLSPSRLWLVPSLRQAMAVDVYRDDGSLVIKAEVPGVSADELEVTVKDGVLTMSGESKAEEEVNEENYVRRERRYGSFCRLVALPAEAEGDRAKASFEDGVLTVIIPVAEEPQEDAVKVEVKAS